MAAIAFQEWLNSEQDYEVGVNLYAAHPGARPALLRLLQSGGPGPFTSSKLVEEISRLSQELPAALEYSSTPVLHNSTAPVPAAELNEKVADLPADVAELVAEKGRLYSEAMHHRAQLTVLPTREQRYQAALIVKRNFRRIDKIWSDLQYREKYGSLPPAIETVAPAHDPAAQHKRLLTLRTYISHKTRGTEAKRAAWTAEIAELERLLAS